MPRKTMARNFHFQVRTREEMWDAANEVAESEDITVADYIRRVLRRDLEARGYKLNTGQGLTVEERVDRMAETRKKPGRPPKAEAVVE